VRAAVGAGLPQNAKGRERRNNEVRSSAEVLFRLLRQQRQNRSGISALPSLHKLLSYEGLIFVRRQSNTGNTIVGNIKGAGLCDEAIRRVLTLVDEATDLIQLLRVVDTSPRQLRGSLRSVAELSTIEIHSLMRTLRGAVKFCPGVRDMHGHALIITRAIRYMGFVGSIADAGHKVPLTFARMILLSPELFAHNNCRRIPPLLNLLRRIGLSQKNICAVITQLTDTTADLLAEAEADPESLRKELTLIGVPVGLASSLVHELLSCLHRA